MSKNNMIGLSTPRTNLGQRAPIERSLNNNARMAYPEVVDVLRAGKELSSE
jgi:hypothetical protein